jgi:Bacterial Ig domain
VKITSPAAGAVLTGVKPIVSASADNVGVVRVTFYVDNVFIGSRVTLPMQWNLDTTTAAKSTHVLVMAAFDAAGNYTKSSNVTVTVQ